MNKEPAKPFGIYLDLDTLLDTRYATLVKLDPVKALLLLEKDEDSYFGRDTDIFKDFDIETFNKAYSERDKETLERSSVTNIIFTLQEMVAELLDKTSNNPFFEGIKVFVNTHPYDIDGEELFQLKDAIMQYTFDKVEVSMVDMSLKEVSPKWIKSNVMIMFLYDFDYWLAEHIGNLVTTKIPEVTMIVPGIFTNTTELTEEKKEQIISDMQEINSGGLNIKDPLTLFREMMLPMIELSFCPIDNYCMTNDWATRKGIPDGDDEQRVFHTIDETEAPLQEAKIPISPSGMIDTVVADSFLKK